MHTAKQQILKTTCIQFKTNETFHLHVGKSSFIVLNLSCNSFFIMYFIDIYPFDVDMDYQYMCKTESLS